MSLYDTSPVEAVADYLEQDGHLEDAHLILCLVQAYRQVSRAAVGHRQSADRKRIRASEAINDAARLRRAARRVVAEADRLETEGMFAPATTGDRIDELRQAAEWWGEGGDR